MGRKCLNLTRPEQVRAYENAAEAAQRELEGDPTHGEIVAELARAYTGYGGEER